MNTSRNSDDLEDIVVGHFEGTLTPDQEQELAHAISTSENAKQLFLSHMRMEGRLHSLGRDGLLREPDLETADATETVEPQVVAAARREKPSSARLWKVLAALAAGLVLMFTWALAPESVNANTVLEQAQLAASELIDRTYRFVISHSSDDEDPVERELEINLRGEGQFLVRPKNGKYMIGRDGTDFWMTRSKSGPIGVMEDYQVLSPELKKRIPNRWLVDLLASEKEPLLLSFPKLLKLIKRSYDIELVSSDAPDSHHLRATLGDGERSAMRTVDLWIATESGVIRKAEIIKTDKRRVRLELLESKPLADQWYQYGFHFPDREVRRVTGESR